MADRSASPTREERTGFAQDFRRFFLRGLALILPPILTFVILLYLWDLLNRKVGEPTNRLIRYAAASMIQESRSDRPDQSAGWTGLSRDLRTGQERPPFVRSSIYEFVRENLPSNERMPDNVLPLYERYLYFQYWKPYRLSFIGLVVAVVFVYFIGHFLATFIGRSMWQAAEYTVFRLPIVRAVYPYMKQFIDVLLSERKLEYSRVVVVEYPRRGIWSLGLVTGEGIDELERATGVDLLTVFIPYTPYSVTGYTITVPRSEVVDLRLSVDQAIRFVVTGGVVRPQAKPDDAARAAASQPRELPRLAAKPARAAARPIRVGTRGSQLARAQAEWVAGRLRELSPGREVRLIEIKTGGDRAPDARLKEIGGEGLFTKEIQAALMSNEVDVAVHSLKDLPTAPVAGLILAAVPHRAPCLDVLVAPKFADWNALPPGSRIGTSSPRRRSQLLYLREDLVIEEIRGNVPTRLRKIDELGLAGVVLAHAGLLRLGLEHQITYRFTPDEMLPAPGQGALGIECRDADREVADLLAALDDPATRAAVTAERAVLAETQGGCHVPLGAYATVADDQIGLRAVMFKPDGSRVADSIAGSALQAESLGRELARRLLGSRARVLS